MQYLSLEKYRDSLLLLVRVLLMLLFVIFGWEKLTGFEGTIGYMASVGAPLPAVAAVIAVVVEFVFGILIILGFYTRPLAIILAIYTVVTGLIGHQYWHMTGMEQYMAMINFYKNVSIAGGFLALALTGPGKFSIDRK
ncbi:DoxX family protein [Tatumella saanichensis]|uniref:DoxX family protein n=1 Tax=Tatumella saanichensis TaxID=480813 RepID=UPI0004A40603|nr:DoxX family protein [Tatumella saanichensis]